MIVSMDKVTSLFAHSVDLHFVEKLPEQAYLQLYNWAFRLRAFFFFSGQFLLASQVFTATIEIHRVQSQTSQVSQQSNPIQDDRGAIRPRQRILGQ